MAPPFCDSLGPESVVPAFERAHSAGDASALDALCRQVAPRVFAFEFLQPEACARLLAEIERRSVERAAALLDQGGGPNSMHDYGAVLADLGMGALLTDLRTRWMAPLAERYFADVGGGEIDGQHGFQTDYARDADDSLGYHVDDSAVTLNLCLGDDFSGSELYFRGLRCDEHRQSPWSPDEEFELEHAVGTAILHAGRHRHGVHPIRRGRRRNLILWMQSSKAKLAAQSCQDWCGEHLSLSPPA